MRVVCSATCTDEIIDLDSSCKSLFINSTSSSLKLRWQNVTYEIPSRQISYQYPFYRVVNRKILTNCSGSAESGSLTAIIGPSGAGKSTLLQILAGRKQSGVSGRVFINHDLPSKRMIKVTYISQNDDFLQNLTVHETLTFTFKLMRHETIKYSDDRDDADASNTVKRILDDLKLTSCAHVRVSRCSGGQLKRLSIACELISPPNIMLLDEPSSGLDSNSALQVMHLLKKLSMEKDIAVIVSIHQPNGKILSLIDSLYVLTHNGYNIYRSSAKSLSHYLDEHGIDCPVYNNPADVILDIASGQYDKSVMKSMLQRHQDVIMSDGESNNNDNIDDNYANSISMSKVFDRIMSRSLPLVSHTLILFHRSFILSLRDPLLFFLSLLQHITVGLVAGLVYTNTIGQYDGCYKEKFINPLLYNSKTPDSIAKENLYTFSGLTLIIVNVIFLFMSTVASTALTFPLEVKVFMKERTNRRYSCLSYYMGRTLADAPLRIVFPAIYSIIIYKLTGQADETYRLCIFCSINVAFAFMAQSVGMFFASVFINSISAAAVNGCISLTPFMLLGGFLVSVDAMPPWAQSLSTVSYFRYIFEASVSTMYGMNRCHQMLNQTSQVADTPLYDLHTSLQSNNLTYDSMFKLFRTYLRAQDVEDDVSRELIGKLRNVSAAAKEIFKNSEDAHYPGRSYVLDTFKVPEFYVWFPIATLVIYFFIFKILAYLVLLYRSTPKR